MRRPRISLATWSVIALVAGLALGMIGYASGAAAFTHAERLLKPVGAVWMAALQFLLIPLIITQLLAAITSAGSNVGRLGAATIGGIVAMLLGAAALTLVVTPPVLSLYPPDPRLSQELLRKPGASPMERSGDWTENLPSNLVESAANGDVFPLLLFAAAFGVAVTRLPQEQREPLARLFSGAAAAMMTVVKWVLVATPAAVFALTFAAALHAGAGAAGMMAAFIVLVCVLLALCIALLYPVTAMAGRVSMRTFARAAAPAQVVALSTLSSIAALPSMIQGATEHLRLPARFTAFVLPLCVSIFKLNRTVSATAKLLFLAHVCGVQLRPLDIALFLGTVIILSFAAVGVPGGGQAFSTLPAYVAAGIPAQAVIVMEATSMAPEILKTVLNVTGDLSLATILSRSSHSSADAMVPSGVVPQEESIR